MHFLVHNGSRDVETRNTRAQRSAHGGLKQFIMNGTRRLLRGRPVQVTLDQLKQHIEEFRKGAKDGILYVTTIDGRDVDLYDDRLPAAPAVPVVNPRPNPPLDSAANDVPHGVPMGTFPGEAPPPKDFTMPVEPPIAAVENNPAASPPAVEDVTAGGLDLSSVIGSGESEPASAEVDPDASDEQAVEETPDAAVTAEVPAAETSEASAEGEDKGSKSGVKKGKKGR